MVLLAIIMGLIQVEMAVSLRSTVYLLFSKAVRMFVLLPFNLKVILLVIQQIIMTRIQTDSLTVIFYLLNYLGTDGNCD